MSVTIRAYDLNFSFDIWRVTNADYLLTYSRYCSTQNQVLLTNERYKIVKL